tara:strand:+ start:1148 stop:1396 length:249 start_codon:yes stop_codon:yes gene_type:complete
MSQYEETVRNIVEIDGPMFTDRQWLSTPFDTFVENPYYDGPTQPHPEMMDWDIELPTTIEDALAEVAVSYDTEYMEYEEMNV